MGTESVFQDSGGNTRDPGTQGSGEGGRSGPSTYRGEISSLLQAFTSPCGNCGSERASDYPRATQQALPWDSRGCLCLGEGAKEGGEGQPREGEQGSGGP